MHSTKAMPGQSSKLLGDGMGLKRGLHRLQGLSHLGFPARVTGVGCVVFPIDEREQALVHPSPPHGREEA